MAGKLNISTKLLLAATPFVVVFVVLTTFAVKASGANGTTEPAPSATAYLGIAILAMLTGMVATYMVAMSVARRLRTVSDRARQMSEEQLPALVAALQDSKGETQLPEVHMIAEAGNDEIGDLAQSFIGVQASIVQVAGDQMAVMRRGVSDIFVTLARRNSRLVDRQLALLDGLEANVDDPDLLGQYYQLDHLATRMRRNGESLLVLSRADSRRRRGAPVDIDNIVRAGTSEIEDYQRVDALSFDPVAVKGAAVADLAHLLAELLDNAASFSAPDTRVDISGRLTTAGYHLHISDEGVGVPADRLDGLNALLHSAPVLGLSVEPTLGLSVVSILAEKHGLQVHLSPHDSGTGADILIPAELFDYDGELPTDLPGPPAMFVPQPGLPGVRDLSDTIPNPAVATEADVTFTSLPAPITGELVSESPIPVSVSYDATPAAPAAPEPDAASANTLSPVNAPIEYSPDVATVPSPGQPQSHTPVPTIAPMVTPTPTELPTQLHTEASTPEKLVLPNRNPGDAAPDVNASDSRNIGAAEPTQLGAALSSLARSISRSAQSDLHANASSAVSFGDSPQAPAAAPEAIIATPVAPEASPVVETGQGTLGGLVLPKRTPGTTFNDGPDERPVTQNAADPDALRSRLSAFSTNTARGREAALNNSVETNTNTADADGIEGNS